MTEWYNHPVHCVFSTSGGYHDCIGGHLEYIGGCSIHRGDIMIHVGDIMSTSGDVQYIRAFNLNRRLSSTYPPDVLNMPRCTQDIPRRTHGFPPMY